MCAILSSVACLVQKCVFASLHKWQDFLKRLLNPKYVFWLSLQLLSEIFLIQRRTEWDTIKKMYVGLRVKYLLFLSDFNETLIFLTEFQKILKYQIQWKFIQCKALFHNSEIISLWEENLKKNIWAHKRKPNVESQNQWRIRQTYKT
jgi:hypothetical protein